MAGAMVALRVHSRADHWVKAMARMTVLDWARKMAPNWAAWKVGLNNNGITLQKRVRE